MTSEAMFLDGLRKNPEDRELWLAYADWLEERGDLRARFLRIFDQLRDAKEGDPGFVSLRAEKERLRPDIDRKWQRLLGLIKSKRFDANVERCDLFEFRCNKHWYELRETESERVRYCTECQTHVHFCETPAETAAHAKLGHCVAVNNEDEFTLGRPSGEYFDIVRGRYVEGEEGPDDGIAPSAS